MTTEPMKLLPCPFCDCDTPHLEQPKRYAEGEDRLGLLRPYVMCPRCGGIGPTETDTLSASDAWNRRAITATRPDAGDLVSGEDGAKLLAEARDFAERMTSQPWACELVERMADFISRLSTAPAGEVVTVPREPTEAMLEATRDVAPLTAVGRREVYRAMIAAAPTPPQTSPATEGEAIQIIRGFLACPEVADCAPEDLDNETR